MVSVELVGIIITGAISICDLGLNTFSLCLSGECRVKICGHEIEHKDTEANLVDLNRRFSSPPPPPVPKPQTEYPQEKV